jgi:hypothetical protein
MTRSVTIPPENGTFAGVDNESYHADRTSISVSGAKLLLPPSCPAKFRHRMDSPPEYKAVFDFGTVTHGLVLGEGGDYVVLDPEVHGLKSDGTVADNPRATAKWKAAEAQARKDGKTPISKSDYERATEMAAVVWTHPLAGEILGAKGEAESSLYVDDPQTGIRLRARPDWMTPDYDPDRLWIADYKTTVTARPEDFARKAADYGYHMQAAWYVTVARLLGLCDDPVFVFIAQEKEAPYLVSVVEFDAEAIAEGHRLNRQAIDLFKRCTDTGEWPGYDDGITPISLPPWAFKSKQTIGDLLT